MNYFNRISEAYVRHFNTLFWLLFSAAAIIFIASVPFGIIDPGYTDVVIGALLAITGLHRIGEEFFNRRLKQSCDDSMRAINELLQWAEKSYDYMRAFKERHEKRIFRLDEKRVALEKKTEDQFRSAVRKIIELENRLNSIVKSLEQPQSEPVRVSREPRLSDLTPTQLMAIKYLRRAGKITNREYRRMFRVSDKKAYTELMFMLQRGLIRREGKGRSTHYVLAF